MALFCSMVSGIPVASGNAQMGQQEEYQKQTESKLKEFKQKLEELKVKAVELKEDSKVKFNREMKLVQKKKAVAERKLEKLKSASSKDWKKMKSEMDAALEDLNKRYDDLKKQFEKP